MNNFYTTAVFSNDVFCWLRFTHFVHSLLSDGIHVDDKYIMRLENSEGDSRLRFDCYILKNLIAPYSAYVRRLSSCREMYWMLIGRTNELLDEAELFVLPAINILNEALRLIGFINNMEAVIEGVCPFVRQVERQLSRDISDIQLKIEELQEHS